MKVKHFVKVIGKGNVDKRKDVAQCFNEVFDGIQKVAWPFGAKDFSINPQKKANGVKPIKTNFVEHLKASGWEIEKKMAVGGVGPGPIDAVKKLVNGKLFAVEWETGNISSSHRAVNKMLLGMLTGQFEVGVLVLPSRDLYNYLTDRIGNYEELLPYFDLFTHFPVQSGCLAVIAIEHDFESSDVPCIPKGTDGMQAFGK